MNVTLIIINDASFNEQLKFKDIKQEYLLKDRFGKDLQHLDLLYNYATIILFKKFLKSLLDFKICVKIFYA